MTECGSRKTSYSSAASDKVFGSSATYGTDKAKEEALDPTLGYGRGEVPDETKRTKRRLKWSKVLTQFWSKQSEVNNRQNWKLGDATHTHGDHSYRRCGALGKGSQQGPGESDEGKGVEWK